MAQDRDCLCWVLVVETLRKIQTEAPIKTWTISKVDCLSLYPAQVVLPSPALCSRRDGREENDAL